MKLAEKNPPQETEEKIHNAYLALCETKPYYKIRVSEVVKAAAINRTTFYRHYTGMPDLILSGYKRFMKQLMSLPAGMTVQTPQDLEVYEESVWDRVMEMRDVVASALHQPGVLRMMIMYGRALSKKLLHYAKKAGFAEPAVVRNIRYTPYLFVVRLVLTLQGEAAISPLLSSQQFHFDFTHSIPDNLSHYMETNLGGSSDFHYALFGAYIKLSSRSDEDAITVTNLLETAGISRTQFYLYYKNMEDFRERFYYTCFELVIELMLYVCRRPDPVPEEEASAMRDTIYSAYNQKAVRRLLSTGKIVEYTAYIIAHLEIRYREQLEKDYGPLDEAQLAKLHYYIGVMITLSLWYYIHKISYSEYHKNVADVKAIMRQALGIEP